MELPAFTVEYDFKQLQLELIDPVTGKFKEQYNCLLYMITTNLSQPLPLVGPPLQPDPLYNITRLTSNSSTNGWINYNIIDNKQPNIITIQDNILIINKFDYNYDIILNVNRISENVDLRFMATNPFTDPPRATNMNDIYGTETVYSNLRVGQRIKFTITGEYQYFFINYPSNNFDFTITIQKSNIETPIYVCDKNNIKACNKCNKYERKKVKKCRCFEIDGRGYLKVSNGGNCVNVPVYNTRDTQSSRVKYLYPEFGYMRDLFFNVTVANSLELPFIIESSGTNSLSSKIISPILKPILKINATTTLTVTLRNDYLVTYEKRGGAPIVDLASATLGSEFIRNCYIREEIINGSYKYSWEGVHDIINILIDELRDIPLDIRTLQVNPPILKAYAYNYTEAKEIGSLNLVEFNRTLGDPDFRITVYYNLPSGSFVNNTGYLTVFFRIISSNVASYKLQVNKPFEMNILTNKA